MEVSFTDWGSKDRFSIDLLGDECSKSVRVLTVRASNGYVLYTNSVRLQQLAVQPLEYEDVLERTLESIRKSVSGNRTNEIPTFDSIPLDDENFYTGGEDNRENYEKAREADKPVMCVRMGYEHWDCFWYDASKGYVKYLYGFGA
ncbi:MAG: hypothetical protein DHS20C05_24010 [Hyphococcus sp.]|nr:MAG: hypothetical protein DHS20C05_24010 [Marinicaulis sp.]